ncbi:MAG: hypothetical protein DMD58_08795 [Gemmatimonadetes bacterium]|nr:MAG: hypothetical protein DMD58_08795 [Gemmatimonadota bacterium]
MPPSWYPRRWSARCGVDKIERAVDDIRRKWAPDGRLAVFEVSIAPKGGAQDSVNVGAQHAAPLLNGVTTVRDARDALRRLANDAGLVDGIRLLVLEARDDWLRVRAPDGYIAWLNAGYVATGPADWAEDWAERATARALSADILTTDGRRRLPTGARVALRRGVVELADGQRGAVAAGNVRREQELRVEARHLALPELAQKWYAGAPYLWGGRTEWGIDCSGLVQAVYGARGITLPRDSDQQFGQGEEIVMASDGAGYEAGDLLFFAERGRVSHVALWAGAGRIVHSALSRGGVGGDNLFGPEPRMVRLRECLVGARRL